MANPGNYNIFTTNQFRREAACENCGHTLSTEHSTCNKCVGDKITKAQSGGKSPKHVVARRKAIEAHQHREPVMKDIYDF